MIETKIYESEEAAKILVINGGGSIEETREEITELVKDAGMVFITCGMESGIGKAPAMAEISKNLGILTVGVVTNALEGMEQLKNNVDTLIVVPDDKLLQQGVQGIIDLIQSPGSGVITLAFADFQSVMKDKGIARVGIGRGSGENKVMDAIKQAMESLLSETTVSDAADIIVGFVGDVNMSEVYKAVDYVTEAVGEGANIIFGTADNETLGDEVSATIIATGIEHTTR